MAYGDSVGHTGLKAPDLGPGRVREYLQANKALEVWEGKARNVPHLRLADREDGPSLDRDRRVGWTQAVYVDGTRIEYLLETSFSVGIH